MLNSFITTAAALALPALVSAQADTQYWHERYHGLLSMAAYGDYNSLCPQTFTQQTLLKSFPNSTETPWLVLQEFGPTVSGISGFIVQIPEMDKIVTVFKGSYGWENLNMTPTDIGQLLNLNCSDCTAHAGAVTAYMEVRNATNDFAVVKTAVNMTHHQWSVTGHDFGGMVAQVAALDLGWRNLCHWAHSHGSPRVFNPAAAKLYNSLFEGEASQRTVANDDSVPSFIPESANYTHVLSGFHIYGTNQTYGMNYENCLTDGEDPKCLGGNNLTDHYFYYTPIGHCGESNETTYDEPLQDAYAASESSAFFATATAKTLQSGFSGSPLPSTSTSTSASSSNSESSSAAGAATGIAAKDVAKSAGVSIKTPQTFVCIGAIALVTLML